jgi:hypothetical protein
LGSYTKYAKKLVNKYYVNKFPYGNLKNVCGDINTAKESFMNKKIILGVMLVCLLVLTNMACFAQSSSNEQRLVGTWTNLYSAGRTIIFNPNGTLSGMDVGFIPTHWAAAGDRLIVFIPNEKRALRYFHISSDGRTLIISALLEDFGTPYRRN